MKKLIDEMKELAVYVSRFQKNLARNLEGISMIKKYLREKNRCTKVKESCFPDTLVENEEISLKKRKIKTRTRL